MTASDWIAILALIVSFAVLSLEIRRWTEAGPKLRLSVIEDAISPGYFSEPKIALSVTNRGQSPTIITNMIVFGYSNIWARFYRKPSFTAIVNNPSMYADFGHHNIPTLLGVNEIWNGIVDYTDKTRSFREKGLLYVGVTASHTSKHYLIRVPRKVVNLDIRSR